MTILDVKEADMTDALSLLLGLMPSPDMRTIF